MTPVRIAISGILVSALAAGIFLYYFQVIAFYDEVTAPDVVLTTVADVPEPIPADDVRAIDSDSSPIRYRACFTTPLSLATLTETYAIYPDAEPLNAPGWFDCYNAQAIGAALEDGTAVAFLSVRDITWGVDRVAAVLPDGRGFVWHQINRCGSEVFDGNPVPEGCPPRPDPASEGAN